jgi:hypothetical protein
MRLPEAIEFMWQKAQRSPGGPDSAEGKLLRYQVGERLAKLPKSWPGFEVTCRPETLPSIIEKLPKTEQG